MQLSLLTLTFFLWGSAFATSEVSKNARVNALSDCRVSATFTEERLLDRKVFWEFQKRSGYCESLHSETILVRIPPGQYVEKLEQFIYPEFLSPPKKASKYTLRLVFFGNEIQFVDWKTGMTAAP